MSVGQELSKEVLENIRQLYVETQTKLADITKETGVKPTRIGRIARLENWPIRPEHSKTVSKTKSSVEDAACLLERIQVVIDATVQQMQRRAAGRKISTAQDDERQMRAMAGLIRNLEKVAELKMKTEPMGREPQPAAFRAVKEAQKNAEALRRDIAQRLARLQRKRDADGRAGGNPG